MHAEFLLFANVMLATRLIYLTNESAISRRANAVMAALQGLAVLLCFQWNAAALGTIGVILLAAILSAVLEPRIDLRSGFRLLTLALLLLVPGYLDSTGQGLEVRGWLLQAVNHLYYALPTFAGESPEWQPLLLILFGILLLANEANIAVRAVFHHCGLEPRIEAANLAAADETSAVGTPGNIDREEYNAGRVIGFLERWLMFLVIIQSNDFSALAFIIAAKGLARMKQLEDRQFAEYMLIGTFLSALCAIVIALYVKHGTG